MSAGVFERSRYEADYGAGTAIHPIRIQPETAELVLNSVTNDPPVGAITNPISVQVSRGRRSLGLHPRFVSIAFTGTPPAEYSTGGTYRVPLLNKAIAAEAIAGAVGTYLGVTCVCISNGAPEIVR